LLQPRAPRQGRPSHLDRLAGALEVVTGATKRRSRLFRPHSRPIRVGGAGRAACRVFPDHGFQFHPLAAFARLNVLITKGRRAEVERLAAALVDRGVPVGNALTWEYYFPVNGGPARWTSALAQAAAADALARAGQLLDDRSLSQSAGGISRHSRWDLATARRRNLGPRVWISDIAILNAQLQTIVSLGRYADITDDRAAQDFVGRLSTAAITLLPQFDTGCWSRYSLDGSPASLELSPLSRRPARQARGVHRRGGLGHHGEPLARISRGRGLPALALDGRLAILFPPRRRSSAGRALHS
jgi:D-glucuronyl C5-epimerase C-terminus